MWAMGIKRGFTAILIAGLIGCVPLIPYHADQDKVAEENGMTPAPVPPAQKNDCYDEHKETCSLFVEYDDFGHLFSRAQLNEVMSTAEHISKNNGIVVVYVHGWHHNAKTGDPDLTAFNRAIENAGILDRKAYKDKRKVMGIYVGWRGESVSLMPFSMLTFWDRKNTAQAIGDGAVFELFRKLAHHREENPGSRLVVVGHSFGAAVTYTSVAHSIMDQIITDPYPNEPNGRNSPDQPKRWDLVVLVNPAFEAMQLRPHFELARSRDYKSDQLPHLLIVTSQDDWATKTAFPAGRYLSTIFKKYADSVSSDMNTTAIGHYIPYITHQLEVSEKCKVGTEITTVNKLGHVVAAGDYCFGDNRALLLDAKTGKMADPVLLTRCDNKGDCGLVAHNHTILRGPASEGKTPEKMPIMNVRTTGVVMSGHNDIWNSTMQGFLVQFMLLTVDRPTAISSIK
ncbi:MAG: hypothetical protein ACJ8G3_15145 [Burkholderiaceae bacterium]